VRVIGLSTKGGTNRYAFSEFSRFVRADHVLTNLTFTEIPPRKPESLTIIPQTNVMTVLHQIYSLRVIARYADGTTSDASTRSGWTSYRISNPNIATVNGDGGIMPISAGIVYVTAVNEGVSAVVVLGVVPDGALTS